MSKRLSMRICAPILELSKSVRRDMADCLNPRSAYVCGKKIAKDGILSDNLVFSFKKAVEYYEGISDPVRALAIARENKRDMPCGKCAICQIRKRKDMSVRLTHEREMHDDACFITLTYDDEHIPMTDCGEWSDHDKVLERGQVFGIPTLLPRDVQLFIKRLRRHLEYQPKKSSFVKRDYVKNPIRYFAVGEYGGKSGRPHYHLIIYGWKPSDATVWQLKKGYTICRSAQVEKLWRYGFSTVCSVNHGVAKYCARYVTKKFARLNGSSDPFAESACPEFTLQSVRRGGIGAPWLDRYRAQMLNGILTVRNGDRVSVCSIPKYYIIRCRKIDRDLFLRIRDQRIDFYSSSSSKPKKTFDDLLRSVACAREVDRYQATQESI